MRKPKKYGRLEVTIVDELREKLITMIQEAVGGCARHWAELIADHLIAHGVTVADGKDTDVPTGWIPASEPPKEPGEYIVAQKHWSDGRLETKKGKWNGVEWLVDGRESLRVAYWMPLPAPPKEG